MNKQIEDGIVRYLRNKPYEIMGINVSKRTERMWITAVKNQHNLLSSCPSVEQTTNIVLATVKGYGEMIRFAKVTNYDIRRAAILSNAYSVQYMDYLEDDLKELALSIQPKVSKLFYTDKKAINEAAVMDIVKNLNCPICGHELLEMLVITPEEYYMECRHCSHEEIVLRTL